MFRKKEKLLAALQECIRSSAFNLTDDQRRQLQFIHDGLNATTDQFKIAKLLFDLLQKALVVKDLRDFLKSYIDS